MRQLVELTKWKAEGICYLRVVDSVLKPQNNFSSPTNDHDKMKLSILSIYMAWRVSDFV